MVPQKRIEEVTQPNGVVNASERALAALRLRPATGWIVSSPSHSDASDLFAAECEVSRDVRRRPPFSLPDR
jgi:hypothetical protein